MPTQPQKHHVDYAQKRRRGLKITKRLIILVWLLLLVLLGLGAWAVVAQITAIDQNNQHLTQPQAEPFRPNVLLILEDDVDDAARYIFTLLRFNTESGVISTAVLPENMDMLAGQKQATLQQQFAYGGAQQAKLAVETTFSIAIDRYFCCSFSTLESLLDELGAVEFTVPEDLYDRNEDGTVLCDLTAGEQSLNSQQVLQFLRYAGWSSETQASEQRGALAGALINHSATAAVQQQMAGLYEQIVNSAQTDVSLVDPNRLSGQYGVFTGGAPAKVITVTGSAADGKFTPDDTAKTAVLEQFK